MDSNISVYSDIVKQVRTKDELGELENSIDSILTQLFHVNVSIDALVETVRPVEVQEAIRKRLSASDSSMSNSTVAQAFFAGVKKELARVKILAVTIAFEPKETTIDMLCNWARSNLLENTVVEVSVDKEILGGVIIVWNGIYKDVSLKAKLDKFFEEEKPTLLGLMAK